jgi:hypothetical protein
MELDMPYAFISVPVFHKSTWDEIHDLHPKTLTCVFIISCRGENLNEAFQECIELIYGMCKDIALGHLKIEAWQKKYPIPAGPKMDQYKTVMFQGQLEKS